MPNFWLWTIVGFAVFGVVYWYYAENELEKQKGAVMARQRAFAVTLGPKFTPVQEKIEGWTQELAVEQWPGNEFSAELSLPKLSESNGIYLRLLIDDARDLERLRRAADHSLHDGFTSCLFVRELRVALPAGAKNCLNSGDCPDGQICNEFDACAAPTQPYNLRLMYRALRILSSKWTDELHQATSDYRVRVFDRDLDKVAKIDVPIALDLIGKARYFTVLLDEMPAAGLPAVEGLKAPGAGEEGLQESEMEQLQAIPHQVRVGIWDLESGEQLVRFRTEAGASFIPLGPAADAPLTSKRARQRQVNNCSIVQNLREAVSGPAGNAATPTPAGGPSGSAEPPQPKPAEPAPGGASVAASASVSSPAASSPAPAGP